VAADEGGDAVNGLDQAALDLATAALNFARAAREAGRDDLTTTARRIGWAVAALTRMVAMPPQIQESHDA
jgi:hypothetical protein